MRTKTLKDSKGKEKYENMKNAKENFTINMAC